MRYVYTTILNFNDIEFLRQSTFLKINLFFIYTFLEWFEAKKNVVLYRYSFSSALPPTSSLRRSSTQESSNNLFQRSVPDPTR